MPIIDCGLTRTVQNLNRPTNCVKKVYVVNLAIAQASQIDLAATTDATTTGVIDGITMVGANTFKAVNVSNRNVTITSSYDIENGYYETLMNVDLGGFDAANRQAIAEMQSMCDLVVYAGMSDCNRMLLGVDKMDGAWGLFDDNEVSAHEWTLGGDEDGSNVVTFMFKTVSPPTFTTVDWATLGAT